MCSVKTHPDDNTARCLAHNPISKYIVTVVTRKTKADQPLVRSTLTELNKEGKKLPAPANEEVQTWVDTQKFATQYDPELNDHERTIQMNQLKRADTEGVSGGNFHAWKNLKTAVQTKLARRLAAGGLVIGMSVSLVGCFSNGDAPDNTTVPTNSPTTISAPQVMTGNGVQVKTDKGSYEQIAIDAENPAYKYIGGPTMEAEGWTEADGIAGQKIAVDYVANEFIDSSALEGGDAEYNQWFQNATPKYFDSAIASDQRAAQPGSGMILGNQAGANSIPSLIHDGKPREASLNLIPTEVNSFKQQGVEGIQYKFNYSVQYRLDDASAAKFAGEHMPTPISAQEFLDSGHANDSLKDGKGENTYTASGTISIVSTKDATGAWKLSGFTSQTQFDPSNFSH